MAWVAPNIQASGTTFAELQAAGATGHLERLISAQVSSYPTTAPSSAATVTAGGSGHTLAAATYYVCVTETNGWGETTTNTPTSVTVTAGESMAVTFNALQIGNTVRNLYLGTTFRRSVFARRDRRNERDDLPHRAAAGQLVRRRAADLEHDGPVVSRRQRQHAEPGLPVHQVGQRRQRRGRLPIPEQRGQKLPAG